MYKFKNQFFKTFEISKTSPKISLVQKLRHVLYPFNLRDVFDQLKFYLVLNSPMAKAAQIADSLNA